MQMLAMPYNMGNASSKSTMYHTYYVALQYMFGTGENLYALRVHILSFTAAGDKHIADLYTHAIKKELASPFYLHLYQYTALVAALVSSELAPC